MIGKTKLGLFVIVAVIISVSVLFILARNRNRTFTNAAFVGAHIGNIYQARQENLDGQARDFT